MKKYFYLILSIIFCQSIGFLGSFFVMGNSNIWYDSLTKPFFQPPNWLFGPVWFVLYTFIGIALWVLWMSKKNINRKKAFVFFWLQLVFNAVWTPVFFGLHALGWSFLIIICLAVFIGITMYYFRKVSYLIFWLFVPYFLWVSFAAILNGSILFLQ